MIWKQHQTFDLTALPDQLEVARNDAEELVTVSETAVRAAEQLYRSGKIDQDERYREAVSYVKKFYPDLNAEILAKNIESAVLLVNTLVSNLPKKENIQ